MNKTIGLAALFLTLIVFRHATSGVRESADGSPGRITIANVASVANVANPDPGAAPPAMPSIDAAPAAPIPPAPQPAGEPSVDGVVRAFAGTVTNLDDSAVRWERRPSQRHPLASLTKLMTAVVALENIGAQKTVTITDDDVREEGDAAGFKSGEVFTVRDLIVSMLLVSSNDAADALARFYGTPLFINAMQQKAADIGLTNTSFFDPSGLSPLNQSTVDDLATLVRYIRDNHPEIFALSRTKELGIVEQTSQAARVLKSINEFAGMPDFFGGKTGYTPEAHGNLVSLFNDRGKTLLIIVLGSDDRFGETRALRAWAK